MSPNIPQKKLTELQKSILTTLCTQSNGIKQSDLKKILDMPASTLSRNLHILESDGYIKCSILEGFKKKILVTLTEKGLSLIGKNAPTNSIDNKINSILSHLNKLSTNELNTFLHLVNKITSDHDTASEKFIFDILSDPQGSLGKNIRALSKSEKAFRQKAKRLREYAQEADIPVIISYYSVKYGFRQLCSIPWEKGNDTSPETALIKDKFNKFLRVFTEQDTNIGE